MLAPEPYLSACLEVLHRAAVHARLLGWQGETGGLTAEQSAELAELMDAIHNIPHLIQSWEHCDEKLLRACLDSFDTRRDTIAGLLATYEHVLASKNRS
jgi:hypothetical protein